MLCYTKKCPYLFLRNEQSQQIFEKIFKILGLKQRIHKQILNSKICYATWFVFELIRVGDGPASKQQALKQVSLQMLVIKQ